MKKNTRLALLMVGILMSLVLPVGAELPPIAMMHTYQGQTSSDEVFVLNFEMMVQNPTDSPLYNVVLVADPLMWLPTLGAANLTVGDLAVHDMKIFSINITTDVLLDEELLREQPLTWFGEYTDTNGKQFVKLIISVPNMGGGAQ